MSSYQQASNYRVGGGCRASRTSSVHDNVDPSPFLKELREKARQREQWLSSPEGQAHLAELRAQEKAAREAQEKREAEAQAEMKRRSEWQVRRDALSENPKVGSVLTTTDTYTVHLQEDGRRPGQFIAFVLVRVEGDYPQEPSRVLQCGGSRGLKVFLGSASRSLLADRFKDAVEGLLKGAERMRKRLEDPDGVDLWIEEQERPLVSVEHYIEMSLPVRIVGYSQTGRSAQGEFVLP